MLLQTVWAVPADAVTLLFVNVASELLEHAPRVTVQRKVFTPKGRLLTTLWPLVGLEITDDPAFTAVHKPVPTDGTAPSKVPWLAHTALDGPPLETMPLLVTLTSLLTLQMPLLTVHVNLLVPLGNELTEVLADDGEAMTPLPVLDHTPLPMDGTTALRLAVFVHTLKSVPAKEADGVLFVMLTSP